MDALARGHHMQIRRQTGNPPPILELNLRMAPDSTAIWQTRTSSGGALTPTIKRGSAIDCNAKTTWVIANKKRPNRPLVRSSAMIPRAVKLEVQV